MNASISMQTTVGQLVAEKPSRSRLFQKLGIDFCCGGKRPLADACAAKGIDVNTVLAFLEADADAPAGSREVDAAAMGLTELADHIQHTHHAYLRQELPRLQAMIARVADVHGAHDPRLTQIPAIFDEFRQELVGHMLKEEQILFPMIRQMDRDRGARPNFHCGSIANPIRVMEMEHDSAGNALEQMRRLTDDYAPPPDACNTYRATLGGLAELEADMHQHVHKENNVLFPRAIELEQRLSKAGAISA